MMLLVMHTMNTRNKMFWRCRSSPMRDEDGDEDVADVDTGCEDRRGWRDCDFENEGDAAAPLLPSMRFLLLLMWLW